MRVVPLVALCLFALATAGFAQPRPSGDCGELVTIPTHDKTTTRYALSRPAAAQGEAIAIVLLPGGGGHLDLGGKGCPRALKGNSLVRSIPHFNGLGFATALVDSPSDYTGEDGLAGFRASPKHAEDLGRVIEDVRARTKGKVWLVGTSRGTISAANAASTLFGPPAPDGLVLTSALMTGSRSAPRPWFGQTVFDLPLEKIRMPVLVIGHVADTCLRSPASLMANITNRTNGMREQVVMVMGGPGAPAGGQASLDACQGRSPHGFIEQEAEVATGIARFIRGGSY
jgi:pimeloyl-ACP methyl ester carboxylesterase